MSGCVRCDLRNLDLTPVQGEGDLNRPLVVVVGRPGEDDALLGRPLECRGGQRFRSLMRGKPFYATAAVRCRGPVKARHVTACRPWLADELRGLSPRAVLAMGPEAARSLYVRPKPPPALSFEPVPGLGVPGAVWWSVDRLRTAGVRLEAELMGVIARLEELC